MAGKPTKNTAGQYTDAATVVERRSAVEPAPDVFAKRAVNVHLRRGQRLSAKVEHKETLYYIEQGLVYLAASVPGRNRQILSLHYPGDLISSSSLPAVPGAELIAASDGQAARLSLKAEFGDDDLASFVAAKSTSTQARLSAHIARLGGMNGDQRLASLFIEFAQRFGRPNKQGVTVDLPLSRVEIADYLALNADTLSRIVSRMKTSGLVTWVSRNRAVIADWDGLCGQSGGGAQAKPRARGRTAMTRKKM